ncbi:hypothetical protein GOBAR_AA38881 [Gossypium barbadense]|uniref:Uncharacterized protein n=1 Tax=Gossypium barbadense TaxID=3634 RepID=A0A2P5VSN1_GOSBA|nr:hypothetical protein GOBAR_AA38881 [Gossypium barbadense]
MVRYVSFWHMLAMAQPLGAGRCINWVVLEQIQLADTTVMTNFDNPRTVQFYLSGLVRQLSIPEFGIALGLYTEEFIDEEDFDSLHRHIHYSPLKCWNTLVFPSATYNPSRSKASALPHP